MNLKKIGLAALALMLVTGCSSSSNDKAEKELVLSTFGLSEDELIESVYSPFEEKFGAKIITDLGTTNERYTKFSTNKNHGIDVIELSQAMTATGIEADLFLEVDTSKLENYDNLLDPVKAFIDNGNGVPYTINSAGIIYNPNAIDFEITDYNDLWNAALEGKIAIPDISTTFGPAMVYMASEYAGVDVTSDDGEAAFEALASLKPNIVKTYTKSSDLVNMFSSGEIAAAVVGDFAVGMITAANPDVKYVQPEGIYGNFNTINITASTKNEALAYDYINYRLSKELQTTTAKEMNEGPTNKTVELTKEETAGMTFGDVANNATFLDYSFVNPLLAQWTDNWNRTLNH